MALGLEAGLGDSVLTTRLDEIINWGRQYSLWPMVFGTACCAIEFMSAAASQHDISRFGAEVVRFDENTLAFQALANGDVDAAVAVVRSDSNVDREYGSAMRSLMTFMMEDPRDIGAILNEMWALRSLERIGDHASNIAEQVVYLVQGLDVRHGHLAQLEDRVKGGA